MKKRNCEEKVLPNSANICLSDKRITQQNFKIPNVFGAIFDDVINWQE